MTDPWLPPAQTHPQPYAQAHPQPYAQPLATGPRFAPAAHGAGRGNGVAIAALVVATLALLGVIGLAVAFAVVGLGPPLPDGAEGYELEGTLPQAEPGRTYSPDEVRTEVERVLENDWSTYEGLECDALVFADGAFASCTGVVDDLDTEIELDVVDAEGHFVLTQYW